MRQSLKCPKCAGQMELGYMLEVGDNNLRSAASWISGAPEESFFFGTTIKNKQQLPIESFRCVQCSYLELYARPPASSTA